MYYKYKLECLIATLRIVIEGKRELLCMNKSQVQHDL